MQDANYNVVALVDGSGNVVERYTYTPFGVQTVYDASYNVRSGGSAYAFGYGFQGMRFDGVSGLNEADERWYSPTLGRWVCNDPMGFGGGNTDLYGFVGNNPANATDATGFFSTNPIETGICILHWWNTNLKVISVQRPLAANYGSVFWPVVFHIGKPANTDKGGFVIQHVRGDATAAAGVQSRNYWEAFRVKPGAVMPEREALKWEESNVSWGTLSHLDRLLKATYQNTEVDRALKNTPANDWFWVSRYVKVASTITWKGDVFYVDGVDSLPDYFKVGGDQGAGGLLSAQDKDFGKDIQKWLTDNKAIGPVLHQLQVETFGGKMSGKTKINFHNP